MKEMRGGEEVHALYIKAGILTRKGKMCPSPFAAKKTAATLRGIIVA